MILIKKIKLFFLYHNRNYIKILKNTSDLNYSSLEDIDLTSLKYQARCSFFTKNYHHSEKCLTILKELNKLTTYDSNILAYLYARHNKKDKAISTWCLTLEKSRNNKIAKNALNYLRKKSTNINLIEDTFFDKLMPLEPIKIPYNFIMLTFILLALAYPSYFLIDYFIFKKKIFVKIINKNKDKINNIYLPDFDKNIITEPRNKNVLYSFNENQIKRKFNNIRNLVLKNEVVLAQISINEIKMSNASDEIKLKMNIFESFLEEPDYAVFKNKISVKEYLKNRDLYRNVYIKWEGKVVNYKNDKNRITFSFILGDDENGIITEIIPVIFYKAIIVNNNDKIVLFGKLNKNNEFNYYIHGLYLKVF